MALAVSDSIKILEGLRGLHSMGFVHGALNPWSVYLYSEDHDLQLYDYGLSLLFRPSVLDIRDPFAFQRVLPYIAPEQTGRLRIKTDHRSDIYSVGILIYRMLS